LICPFLYKLVNMESKNLFNRKELKPLRSALRNKSTSAEAALWNILKSRNIEGKKFRRQYSIGKYIADFCCPSEKLIIELDGAVHGEYQRITKDELRDQFIESLGFKVLRFENKVVFQDPEFLQAEIRKFINREKKSV